MQPVRYIGLACLLCIGALFGYRYVSDQATNGQDTPAVTVQPAIENDLLARDSRQSLTASVDRRPRDVGLLRHTECAGPGEFAAAELANARVAAVARAVARVRSNSGAPSTARVRSNAKVSSTAEVRSMIDARISSSTDVASQTASHPNVRVPSTARVRSNAEIPSTTGVRSPIEARVSSSTDVASHTESQLNVGVPSTAKVRSNAEVPPMAGVQSPIEARVSSSTDVASRTESQLNVGVPSTAGVRSLTEARITPSTEDVTIRTASHPNVVFAVIDDTKVEETEVKVPSGDDKPVLSSSTTPDWKVVEVRRESSPDSLEVGRRNSRQDLPTKDGTPTAPPRVPNTRQTTNSNDAGSNFSDETYLVSARQYHSTNSESASRPRQVLAECLLNTIQSRSAQLLERTDSLQSLNTPKPLGQMTDRSAQLLDRTDSLQSLIISKPSGQMTHRSAQLFGSSDSLQSLNTPKPLGQMTHRSAKLFASSDSLQSLKSSKASGQKIAADIDDEAAMRTRVSSIPLIRKSSVVIDRVETPQPEIDLWLDDDTDINIDWGGEEDHFMRCDDWDDEQEQFSAELDDLDNDDEDDDDDDDDDEDNNDDVVDDDDDDDDDNDNEDNVNAESLMSRLRQLSSVLDEPRPPTPPVGLPSPPASVQSSEQPPSEERVRLVSRLPKPSPSEERTKRVSISLKPSPSEERAKLVSRSPKPSPSEERTKLVNRSPKPSPSQERTKTSSRSPKVVPRPSSTVPARAAAGRPGWGRKNDPPTTSKQPPPKEERMKGATSRSQKITPSPSSNHSDRDKTRYGQPTISTAGKQAGTVFSWNHRSSPSNDDDDDDNTPAIADHSSTVSGTSNGPQRDDRLSVDGSMASEAEVKPAARGSSHTGKFSKQQKGSSTSATRGKPCTPPTRQSRSTVRSAVERTDCRPGESQGNAVQPNSPSNPVRGFDQNGPSAFSDDISRLQEHASDDASLPATRSPDSRQRDGRSSNVERRRVDVGGQQTLEDIEDVYVEAMWLDAEGRVSGQASSAQWRRELTDIIDSMRHRLQTQEGVRSQSNVRLNVLNSEDVEGSKKFTPVKTRQRRKR